MVNKVKEGSTSKAGGQIEQEEVDWSDFRALVVDACAELRHARVHFIEAYNSLVEFVAKIRLAAVEARKQVECEVRNVFTG